MARAKAIKTVENIPAGYRGVQRFEPYTENAVRVWYYKWELIVPRKSCLRRKADKSYWVQAWAIDSAKLHRSAHYYGNV